MKLLGLPGKSPTTLQWIDSLLNSIDIGESVTNIQEYDCWHTQGEEIDIDLESKKAKAFNPDVVLAKSLGTVVALFAFAEQSHKMKFIFIGTPVKIYNSELFTKLKDLTTQSNVFFIQQSSDRMGSVKELQCGLPADSTIFEVTGDDHLYNEIEILSTAIESWYKSALQSGANRKFTS